LSSAETRSHGKIGQAALLAQYMQIMLGAAVLDAERNRVVLTLQ